MVEQSLEAWAGASWCDGLQLDSCQDLEHILVRTANTVYQLIVLHGRAGEVLIRGGVSSLIFVGCGSPAPLRVATSSSYSAFIAVSASRWMMVASA
jgi:hypothetical protein